MSGVAPTAERRRDVVGRGAGEGYDFSVPPFYTRNELLLWECLADGARRRTTDIAAWMTQRVGQEVPASSVTVAACRMRGRGLVEAETEGLYRNKRSYWRRVPGATLAQGAALPAAVRRGAAAAGGRRETTSEGA